MKKVILILIGCLIAVMACGQVTRVNITIQKPSPQLFLNGTSASINFYNDLLLQQSTNKLTLSGGNFDVGSNSILGTGSIGATGAGKFLKIWSIDIESTNTPSINGTSMSSIFAPISHTQAQSTITNLVDSLLARYTKTQSGSLFAPISHIQAQSTITALADSLLARYTKTQTNTLLSAKANTSHDQAQSTITVLSDSLLARYTKTQVNSLLGAKLSIADSTDGKYATKKWTLDHGGATDTTHLSARIDLKAPTASPNFTTGITTPAITLGAVGLTSTGTELNLLHGVPVGLTTTEIGYMDGVTSAIQTQLNNTIVLGAYTHALTDSVYSIQIAAAGSGAAGDTACFRTGRYYGSWKNGTTDTLVFVKMVNIVSGTCHIHPDIQWGTTFGSVVTHLISSPPEITGVTETTSFNNQKLAPAGILWSQLSAITTQPTYWTCTLYFYLIPNHSH